MKVIEYALSWQIYSWLDQELTFNVSNLDRLGMPF